MVEDHNDDLGDDLSGLGDDRSHTVYFDGGHNGQSFDANNSTQKEFVWIDARTSADDLGHRFEVAVNQDDITGDWVIQNEKVDVFQSSGINNIDASLLAGVKVKLTHFLKCKHQL